MLEAAKAGAPRLSRWRLAVGLGFAALIAQGCVAALGLDEREDAVFGLCQCSQQLPQLGDCYEVLSNRLSFAAPDARAAWLAFYEDNCRDSCGSAYQCYAQSGTCAVLSCASHEECCGFGAATDSAAYCDLAATNPSCKTCSNTVCDEDSDCCSFRQGAGFCDLANNTCSTN